MNSEIVNILQSILPSNLIVVSPVLIINPKSRQIFNSLSDKPVIDGTNANKRIGNDHSIKLRNRMMNDVYLLYLPVNYRKCTLDR